LRTAATTPPDCKRSKRILSSLDEVRWEGTTTEASDVLATVGQTGCFSFRAG
jgi:hypothetical protein